MRRHDLTSASLMISLACLALLGNWSIGADPLHGSSSQSPEAENSQIVEGSKVTFQYVTRVPGSTKLNSGAAVSEFIQGRHDIFPALEHEVVGMKPGEEKQVELSPEESFGPHDDGKQLIIPKALLPPGAKQGDIVQNNVGEFATVVAVGDMAAVLDYNHPLAGKPIVVQVKILKVENPSADTVKSEEGQKGVRTIRGEVLRIEHANYFVKQYDGKEVRLEIDEMTQMTGNIGQGERVEAKVTDQNHALFIRSAQTAGDRRNAEK